jgi:acyl CoA:acetate/3-ketoacid CoA transferase beta subunit
MVISIILGIGGSPERGEEDELLCNAAGFPVSTVKGASYFDSALSFAMIRKGLIDITILGALQVILLSALRTTADPKDAVFRLQHYLHAGRQKVRH